MLLDNALKAILAGEQAPGAYNKPYGMAIRTRKVEDVRRKEFEEARKKPLKNLKSRASPPTNLPRKTESPAPTSPFRNQLHTDTV